MGKVFEGLERPGDPPETEAFLRKHVIEETPMNEPAANPPADSLAFGTPHAQGSAIPRRTRPRNPAPQPGGPVNPGGQTIPALKPAAAIAAPKPVAPKPAAVAPVVVKPAAAPARVRNPAPQPPPVKLVEKP
jgi:hypothetical protein